MDMEKLNGRLEIATVDGQSQVRIQGNGGDVLLNLAILTAKVCETFDITVEDWAMILPAAVQGSCGCIRQSIGIQAFGKKRNYETGGTK